MFLVIAWHRVHRAKAPDALVLFSAQCILQLCCANSFFGAGQGMGGRGGTGRGTDVESVCSSPSNTFCWWLAPQEGAGYALSSQALGLTWLESCFLLPRCEWKPACFCDVICIMLSVSSFTTFLSHDWSVGCGAAHFAWGYIPLYQSVETAWSYLSCTMGTAPVDNTSTKCILDTWW